MTSKISQHSSKNEIDNHIDNNTPPSIEYLNLLLDAAIKASKEAGKIIVSNLDSAEVSKLKANPRDLLTEIDPLCESTIRDIILNQFPHHKFLGEEAVDPGKDASALALENKLKGGGEDGDCNSDFLWIVDPIDGMFNVYVMFSNFISLKSKEYIDRFHSLVTNSKFSHQYCHIFPSS